MDRSSAVALVTAAVIGIGTGTGTAVWQSQDSGPSAAAPDADAASGPSASPTPAPDPQLLYATGSTIFDGDRKVAHGQADLPLVVVRAEGGYVVSLGEGSSLQDTQQLTYVDSGGETTPIASVTGDWDLDPAGARIAGVDGGTRKVTVWDLDAKVQVIGDKQVDPRTSVVFAGDGLLASEFRAPFETMRTTVDLDTGATRREPRALPSYLTASPDGGGVAGSVDVERIGRLEGAACLQGGPVDSPEGLWSTCDWRRQAPVSGAEFSPSGSGVLAIPSESDGFGPSQFAILDRVKGADSLTRVDVPEWTFDATFADDTSLFVRSATDGNLDSRTRTVLSRCDEQSCRAIAEVPGTAVRLGTRR